MILIEPGLDIVVVDDNAADLLITEIVLKRSHLTNPVALLDSGEGAVAYLGPMAARGGPPPALVMIDVNMYGMTGFDVLRFIRRQEAFQELPVVAILTSSDAESDKQSSMELGANAFLAKKSGVAAFVEMINANFKNRE